MYGATIKTIGLTIVIAITHSTCNKCSFTTPDTVSCINVTIQEYEDELWTLKPAELQQVSALEITNSYLPKLGPWLSVPDLTPETLRIVNCSVREFQLLDGMMMRKVQELDLSSNNNISNYKFLHGMSRLKRLRLRHREHPVNETLFAYLSDGLDLLDLRYGTFKTFQITHASIKAYDLSFNPKLTQLTLVYTQSCVSLNLSGVESDVDLQVFKLVKPCLSLDWSRSNKTLAAIPKSFILTHLSLKHNNLFRLKQWDLKIPSGRFSVILTNCSINYIPPNLFLATQTVHLDELRLDNNNLTRLNGTIFRKTDILLLDLSNSRISSIEPEVFQLLTVERLKLSNNLLRNITNVLSQIEVVFEIDLSNNPIDLLAKNDFTNCNLLRTLTLSNVFLATYQENPFFNIPTLRELSLTFSNSVDAAMIRNIHLTDLNVVNSNLNALSSNQFKGFHRLRQLTFVNSTVKSVHDSAFQGLYMLKQLDSAPKPLPVNLKSLRALTSLKHLDLSQRNLQSLLDGGLETLISLRTLNLSGNVLTVLNGREFYGLKRLQKLWLCSNAITHVDVKSFNNLQELTHLYLNRNKLQQLDSGTFSGLNRLLVLDLSENGLIRTKPHLLFALVMPKLQKLLLAQNNLGTEFSDAESNVKLTEFNVIAQHKTSKYIDINENNWKCATLVNVLSVFKHNNVSYKPIKPIYTARNIDGVVCSV